MMVSSRIRLPNLDVLLLLLPLCVSFLCAETNSSTLTPATRHYGYKINPKPCKVKSDDGTCMFVWECIKTEGRHLGMCMDGFMFGSCCAHNVKDNVVVHNDTHFAASTASPVTFAPSSHFTLPPSLLTSKPINVSPFTVPSWSPPLAEGDAPFVTRPKPTIHFQHNASTVWLQSTAFQATPQPPLKPFKPPRPLLTKTPRPTTTTTTTTTTTPRPTTSTAAATTTGTTPRTTTTFAAITASPVNKPAECGVPPLFPRPEVRIVGGKNAPFGRWPWQVSVRRTSFFGFSSTHRCGGALINEQWVATAGHCVDDLLTSQIRIRMGEYDFSSVLEPYPYVERGVVKKVVHPRYNFFTYENDLALVRLEQAVEFYPHISPVCLPGSDDLLIGDNGTVTGWGRLSEGGTLPSVLQEVTVPIISNEKCRSMFLKAGRQEYIPEIFLCAGYEEGGRDSCQGDSGGPLQVRGSDGRYFLAGIISWGIGCAEPNLPGVCTRISKFVEWILQNVT